jgi:PAS domain S-box-containing protein
MSEQLPADDHPLHALSETIRAFAEATADYARLVATVAERMSAHIGDGAFVAVVSDDHTVVNPAAASFRDPAVNARAQAFLTAGPIHLESSTIGARVVRSRTPLRLPTVDIDIIRREVTPSHAAMLSDIQVSTMLVVPLKLHERVLGFISLARLGPQARAFSDDDEAVARNLAEHAALAISNAQLLQSLQRELEHRRRAEESVARFGALIEHSGEFIAMATLTGDILFVNRGGRQMVGIDPDEDLGKLRLSDFHTEEGMKRAPVIRATGRWQGRGQLRNIKTGELIDTQVSSFLVRDAAGEPVCFATVQHDVRETKQLEAQLRQAQKMEAIGTLAGGIAHDFNNILTAILSNLDLARLEIEPQHPAHEYLEEIAGASQRAVALVRQILTFGRERDSTKRNIRLKDVVTEALSLLRSTLPAGVELTPRIDAETPTISADPTQIHQILMNLCTNAWQALDGLPGRIEIDVAGVPAPEGRPPQRYARLRVTDTGHGMDAATIERIFDPFFTTKAPGEGTGLGLSVVHGIVKDHRGTIRVDSARGKGTTFDVLLPGISGENETAAAGAEPRVGRGGRRLLYLDDEPMLVRSTEALLRRCGYEVRAFTEPHDLFETLRRDPLGYELVLTDHNMPRLSGIEVAKIIRDIRADLPVVLLSGYVPERLHEEAARAGVKQVLHKPCTVTEICAAIERHAAMPKLPSQ